MRPPNILLIMTDQQRADHVGCYGNPTVRTPNIDRLAARGVRFDRFYVATPSCMPNRASLATGRMPSSHGVWTNGVPLSPRATTYVHHLREAGYRTALIGKSHLQAFTGIAPVTQPAAPKPGLTPPPPALRDAVIDFLADFRHDQELFPRWEEDEGFDVTRPFYGFDHVDLLVQHGDTTSGHYARWAKAKDPHYKKVAGPDNEAGGHGYTAPWAWRSRLPVELHPTTFVEEQTVACLEHYGEQGPDTPFFIQCSFADPHHPFCPPGRFWDMYDPAEVELPPSFAATNDPPPHVAALWRDRDEGRRDRWTHLPMAVSEQEAREAIALTYGMVTMIDEAIGRIVTRLEALGLAEDTIVVFMSDHGDLMGDHQLLLKGPLHYQGLIRTPFIWADPAGPRGTSVDALSSAVDFAPTVLERVGLQPNYGIQGQSLLDVAAGQSDGHDGVLIEEDPQRAFMGFSRPPRARTLVTGSARITVFENADWGELYDLESDPHEMRNLWDDREPVDLKVAMLHALSRKTMECGNRVPLPTNRG